VKKSHCELQQQVAEVGYVREEEETQREEEQPPL
jgi:hypothetical protein